MTEERYELAVGRIREIKEERTVSEPFLDYFQFMSDFVMMIDELNQEIAAGRYRKEKIEGLREWNQRLYADILPEHYGNSYADPCYAVSHLGAQYGQILSFLYTELRGAIAYTFEQKEEYLVILFELLIQIYNEFEQEREPDIRALKDIIYWYASDYCDVFAADRVREQIDPGMDFAVRIIMDSDLSDLSYLYQFGEYISENVWRTAEHLMELPEDVVRKMADVYTQGYLAGFVSTGRDLSKKSVVNIRYVLGFERMIKIAIDNFAGMGLRPVIYRSPSGVLTKRGHARTGYYGDIPNKQFDYDHRDDQGLFLDGRLIERKLEVIHNAYEQWSGLAGQMAGPACVEVFGEEPFSPEKKEECVSLTKRQEELLLKYDQRSGQITNNYIPGDERSYTIVSYPVPEIGGDYEAIFDETVRINTLDAKLYERVQKTLIDALDQGEYVLVRGRGGNRTDLRINLHKLNDPGKETIFENCVADVNIPVGEVFTSPVLEGTNGTLHVGRVYLHGLLYKDLELHFRDGRVTDYTCANFALEQDNKKYISNNILHNHASLPLGEFAIGTNTTAYAVVRKYGIEEKMPILIAEKTGPHFAVGDTCYSWSEDVRVYNPDGKEIVAKDNSVSIRRKTDVSEAYFQCHTDITLPYEELDSIVAVTADGGRIPLLEGGGFVLGGTEILNEPLKNCGK